MGREFELKFSATEAQQDAIRAKFGDFTEITMATTYYDTPDHALAARHITLRQRLENGQPVCTVKTPHADGGRGEWELQWENPATMVEALCNIGAPVELLVLTTGSIIPVCGARFTRLAKAITLEGGTAELALDRGILMGGNRQIPLCEVEVELKSGADEATISFARSLAVEFELIPQHQSKFRRAQKLAEEN